MFKEEMGQSPSKDVMSQLNQAMERHDHVQLTMITCGSQRNMNGYIHAINEGNREVVFQQSGMFERKATYRLSLDQITRVNV